MLSLSFSSSTSASSYLTKHAIDYYYSYVLLLLTSKKYPQIRKPRREEQEEKNNKTSSMNCSDSLPLVQGLATVNLV
jgi:hypothetical protein